MTRRRDNSRRIVKTVGRTGAEGLVGARVLNLIGWLLLATAAVIVGYAIYEISRNFNGYYVGAEKGFAWIIGAFLVAIAVPIGLLGRSLSRQGRETSDRIKTVRAAITV